MMVLQDPTQRPLMRKVNLVYEALATSEIVTAPVSTFKSYLSNQRFVNVSEKDMKW